jgi:hypothetical protein
MGSNRKDGGRSSGFIESVIDLLNVFYASVLQQVTPWTASPPQSRATTGELAELVHEPIEDRQDLEEAISSAVAVAADETGPAASPTDNESLSGDEFDFLRELVESEPNDPRSTDLPTAESDDGPTFADD